MALVNRSTLEGYFNAGDRPLAGDFLNLIDSNLNLTDGGVLGASAVVTGLEQYVISVATTQVGTDAVDVAMNLTQPAGTVLTDVGIIATAATVGTGTSVIRVGTADDGQELCADKDFCASGVVAIGQSMSVINGSQGEGAESLAFVSAAPMYSAASRTIYIKSQNTATLTAGTFITYIKFMKIV
jgi:hypothetical protein